MLPLLSAPSLASGWQSSLMPALIGMCMTHCIHLFYLIKAKLNHLLIKFDVPHSDSITECGSYFSCFLCSPFRNIMMLLNLFNPAEGTVAESHYNEMQQKLNSRLSGSEVVQGLDLSTCNLRMRLGLTWGVISPLIVLVIFVFYIVNKVRDKLTYLESKLGMFHMCRWLTPKMFKSCFIFTGRLPRFGDIILSFLLLLTFSLKKKIGRVICQHFWKSTHLVRPCCQNTS